MCSRLFEFPSSFIIILIICSLTQIIHGNLSIICGQVPTGEFVRSSISCNTYNYCHNGKTHTATCPQHFLFNAKKQICDRAELVDCTECSERGVQHLADPRNCRKYYRCALGVRVHRTCPNGLRFDPKIGNCNFESQVPCVEQSICSSFGHSGAVYIGNPQDCNSYFMCFNGLEVKHYCQTGLYFNSLIGICEQYPTNCQTSSGPINVVTELPSITTTTVSPTTASPIFTPQCSNYISFGLVFISNPYDCSSYFSCVNGILYNHKCAANTFYNAYTTQCGAYCEGSGQIIVQTPQVTSSTNQPTTSTTVRQTTGQTTTTRTTTVRPTVPSFTTIPPTPTTIPSITTTRSPTTTTRSPTTTTRSPTTTTQRPTTVTPTTPAPVTTPSTTPSPPPPTTLPTTTPPPPTTTPAPTTTTPPPPSPTTTPTPIPGDSRCITRPNGNNFVTCTSFANCAGGLFNYVSNCVYGTYFNDNSGVCSAEIPDGCVEITTTPPITTTVAATDPRCIRPAGYFLIVGSCTEYVYCIRGAVRFEYTCDEGTFYDPMREQCTSTRPDGC